jgi:hypothetical protein
LRLAAVERRDALAYCIPLRPLAVSAPDAAAPPTVCSVISAPPPRLRRRLLPGRAAPPPPAAMSAAAAAPPASPPPPPPPPPRALDRLHKVLNARDLAEATPRVRPGRVFRAGNPAHGSIADAELLRRELNVRCMVDFRSAEEHAEDSGWPLMGSGGVIRSPDGAGGVSSEEVEEHASLAGAGLARCEVHRIPLLERDRFVRGLLWRLPIRKMALAGAYRLAGWHEAMRDVLVPEINRGGLAWVYQILMESAQAQIRRALEVVLEAAERGEPALVFCKLGKDRTGLVSALILAAAGASEEEIVADYVRSDGVDAVALGGLERGPDTRGMDPAIFSRAPAAAMRAVLAYARRRWGGLPEYMAAIGFGPGKQARLARALGAEAPPAGGE